MWDQDCIESDHQAESQTVASGLSKLASRADSAADGRRPTRVPGRIEFDPCGPVGHAFLRPQFLIEIEVIAAAPPSDKYRERPAVVEEENGAGEAHRRK